MDRASIYYIEENGDIANAVFECNMTSGLFQSQGNWIVSSEVPSIHPNTGLAAVLLGEDGGYRVYYHDNDGAINELGYTTEDQWQYLGVISQDVNSLPALAAAFTGKDNITVASPRDDRHIGITRWHKDETWHRSTRPSQTSFISLFFLPLALAVPVADPADQQPCREPFRAISSQTRRLGGILPLTRQLRPTSACPPGMARPTP